MANTRTFNIPGIFAEDAQTVIPASPITGTAYRDPNITGTQIEGGFAFDTVASSSFYNQTFFLAYSALSEIDRTGILGWSENVDYTIAGGIVRGSDGVIYVSQTNSGSNTPGGVRDPVIAANRPEFWESLSDSLGVGTGTTNLSNNTDANSVTIVSSAGSNTTVVSATTSNAGVLSAGDKTRLDGIETGAQVNVQADFAENDSTSPAFIQNRPSFTGETDLTITQTLTDFTINSSTGEDVRVPSASPGGVGVGAAGALTGPDKLKLDGIEDGAEVNQSTEEIQDITGTFLSTGNGNVSATYNDAANTVSFNVTGVVPVANGGTGANTVNGALTALNLAPASVSDAISRTITTTRSWSPAALHAAIGSRLVPDVIIEDRVAQGVNGGSSPDNAVTTRRLNTIVRNANSIASLSGNILTLDGGDYWIVGYTTVSSSVFGARSRIANAQTSAVLISSSTSYSENDTNTHQVLRGLITTSSPSIQLRVTTQVADDDGAVTFGQASGFGTEVYTHLDIWKVS